MHPIRVDGSDGRRHESTATTTGWWRPHRAQGSGVTQHQRQRARRRARDRCDGDDGGQSGDKRRGDTATTSLDQKQPTNQQHRPKLQLSEQNKITNPQTTAQPQPTNPIGVDCGEVACIRSASTAATSGMQRQESTATTTGWRRPHRAQGSGVTQHQRQRPRRRARRIRWR